MIKYYQRNIDWELKQQTEGSAGFDLKADLFCPREVGSSTIDSDGIIQPGQRWLVRTGLWLAMPVGVCAFVCSRSGLAINHGVVVLNAPGIIDSDYRKEISVSLINLGQQSFTIVPGERIAQIVFGSYLPQSIPLAVRSAHQYKHEGDQNPFEITRVGSVEDLGDPGTRTGGHGSTGR